MGRAIGANQARPIECEQDRQFLECDIVDDLVVGALQKCGVNRHHRLQSITRHSSSDGDRVLFRNGNVQILVRELARVLDQS